MSRSLAIGLNAVIVAVSDEEPKVLVEKRLDALPFGPLDPEHDRTLELSLRGWIREQAGIEVGYVEQLYTFGDQNRDPRERHGGPRVISIGYLTLGRQDAVAARNDVSWRDWYAYLPWEDWRDGRPRILARIESALGAWADEASPSLRAKRKERVDIAFGFHGTPWDGYRVLDRYELLYEAGLVAEALRDRERDREEDRGRRGGESVGEAEGGRGRPMRFDHRRILATAISRLRGRSNTVPWFSSCCPTPSPCSSSNEWLRP